MRVFRFSALSGRIALEPSISGLMALAALFLALIVLILASVMLRGEDGPYGLTALTALTGGGSAGDQLIVGEFRLPRALVALGAGGLLGLAGALTQGATRNPLSDPALLGISQGAALAVIAFTLLIPEIADSWRPLAAFFGGLGVAALILALSHQAEGTGPVRLLLTGIGLAAFLNAMTMAFLTYGGVNEAHAALAWIAGSVRNASWGQVGLLAAITPLAWIACIFATRPLTALGLGDELATVLGHKAGRSRIALMALAAVFAAASVAVTGPIAFVGLVAPHLAARLAKTGPGLHLALTWVTGAALTGLADLAGRVLFPPTQVPAGLVTALVGAPLMAVLMIRTLRSKPT